MAHTVKRKSNAAAAARPAPPAPGETASDRTYRIIRSDILFGRLKPSQKLRLEQLKADYATSVSTLREILNRLSSEHLVVAEGQRGFEVAPVSVGNLREIAELRLLLECHALEQSFGSANLEWEGRIVAAHHKLSQMEARMKSGDRSAAEQWKLYDWQFHQALISACGSKTLMETHAAAFDKYLRYQMIALSYRGDVAEREHRQLLDYALKRDAKAAGEVLVRHVNGGVEHALATGTIR